jgi:hypothetical protein
MLLAQRIEESQSGQLEAKERIVKLRSGLFTLACAVLALPLALAACGGASTNESPASTTAAAPPATAGPTTRAPVTTISERLAHWRDVVQTMKCPELADLEQKRLAVQFNDQTESLIAIHDRQAALHCPQ